jgi:hypothetical protein
MDWCHRRAIVFALGLVLAGSLTFAQLPTPPREQANLSPIARAKLDLIESLSLLPASDWKTHAGDIPQGESVSLDDSSWPVVLPLRPASVARESHSLFRYPPRKMLTQGIHH